MPADHSYPQYQNLIARFRTTNNLFAVTSPVDSDTVRLHQFTDGWTIAEEWRQNQETGGSFEDAAIKNSETLIDIFYDPTNTDITVFRQGELLNMEYGQMDF